MTVRKTLAALLGAASLGLPAAANGNLGDLEIAHAAYTAGEIDIRYAHLALALSESEAVRGFAATMIRDHSAVNEAAGNLLQKLQAVPVDNSLSQALTTGAAAKRAELSGLTGKAFDCAYAENELGYHELVNQTVAESFIPAVTVAELRDLLGEALVTFRAHEEHARHMVESLDCGS